MPLPVSDLASNANENIAHAATIIGRSGDRRKVFNAIYTGKKKVKSVNDISKTTTLSNKRILEEGKKLEDNHLVTPTKINSRKAYEKIDFYHTHKKKILALVSSPDKLKKYPTKRNPASSARFREIVHINVHIPRSRQQARLLTVDEIESFSKVKAMSKNYSYKKMPEARFKQGIAKILGEKGDFKDWGGENRDLASTRVMIHGKRRSAAFAFKGPGQSGKLTPGKMGRNGDQIQRLLKCPAEVFIVQYWRQIDDAVLDQLEKIAQLKSYQEEKEICYGIIDGVDSTRLIEAYPEEFR